MDITLGGNQWANICTELLDEIVKFIDSYGDYVRFCAVCKLWNLSKIPSHLKFPLLVLPSENKNSSTRPIYYPGDKKVIHMLELPTHNTLICGSSYGWLITIGLDGELQMLQPFTKVRIDLPRLFTSPDIIHKIILSSGPDDDDQDFMAVALYGECYRLVYCMLNDKEWKDFIEPKETPIYEDFIFHEGQIYAIDQRGVIYEYDIKTKVGRLSEAPINECLGEIIYPSGRYLVSTSDGLLSIEKYVRSDEEEESNKRWYHTYKFRVFILSQSEWTEVKNLGDNMIVIGCNSSICYAGPCACGKTNCIYYSDDRVEFHLARDLEEGGGHDNGIFYLQDESIHSYDHLFPGDDVVFPIPIWLL